MLVMGLASNMLILIELSHATQVILDRPPNSEKLVARGVKIVCDNHSYIIHAKREVILCAGALKTPQILELSGRNSRVIS